MNSLSLLISMQKLKLPIVRLWLRNQFTVFPIYPKQKPYALGIRPSVIISICRTKMPIATIFLKVEDPHYSIRLYEHLLKIDLKGSFKNELEEALENKQFSKKQSESYLEYLFRCTYP